MPRYFTHYWTNKTWDAAASIEQQQLLDHIASNLFCKRGIQSSDYVYVVTVKAGCLYLLGSMLVGMVCDSDSAAKQLNTRKAALWDAADHLIAEQATIMNFSQLIPDSVAQSLRFMNADGQKKLFFRPDGLIDQQTLRGVRELTPDSAQLLTDYHGPFQALSRAKDVSVPTQKSNQASVQQAESSLLNYHKSIYLEFESTKDRIRSLLGHQKHWLSDGEHKEAILRKILRQHVPEIMRIGTGFVSFPNGNGSNQQDILITDIRKPTLFKDHDLTIVTPDAVRAIIEVKTSQNKAQLQNTLTKMADNIANIRASREHDIRCFAGLFIYEAPQIKLNIILEVLHKVAAGDYNRVIDFVAFGASTFIQFSYTQFRSAMMDANTWYRYEIENLAPAYFISHLAWHLTEQRSQMSRLAYFPLGESIRQNIKQHLLLS